MFLLQTRKERNRTCRTADQEAFAFDLDYGDETFFAEGEVFAQAQSFAGRLDLYLFEDPVDVG